MRMLSSRGTRRLCEYYKATQEVRVFLLNHFPEINTALRLRFLTSFSIKLVFLTFNRQKKAFRNRRRSYRRVRRYRAPRPQAQGALRALTSKTRNDRIKPNQFRDSPNFFCSKCLSLQLRHYQKHKTAANSQVNSTAP